MPNPAQQRLDAMAKKKGFPNYAAMKAWNEKYRAPVTNSGTAPKKNFFQRVMSRIHPMNVAAEKVDRAVKKSRRQ
jgi:hypothetical protein